MRDTDRAGAGSAANVAERDLSIAGEVVRARLPRTTRSERDGGGDVVVVHELQRGAGVGHQRQHPLDEPRRALQHARQLRLDLRPRHRSREHRRFRTSDDARPQHVDLEIRTVGDLAQQRLALGLLLGVVVLGRSARRHVLGQRHGVVGVIAIRRHRRRIDQPARTLRCDRRLEDVARAGQVDAPAVLTRTHDQVSEMDDHVGSGHQRVDRVAIQDVALVVLGLRPAVLGRIERTARHPDDLLDFRVPLHRVDRRDADLAGRSGHCDGQRHWRLLWRSAGGTHTYSASSDRTAMSDRLDQQLTMPS